MQLSEEISVLLGEEQVERVFTSVSRLWDDLFDEGHDISPHKMLLAYYILTTTLIASSVTDLDKSSATSIRLLVEVLTEEALEEGVLMGEAHVLDEPFLRDEMQELLKQARDIIAGKNE